METSLVSTVQLVKAIAKASEKAACIARSCRAEEELFSLLVEEKGTGEKNKRFIQDFKTLADVLVQATVQHDLQQKFPGIGSHIYGEESNHFTNVLGESIDIEICETEEETLTLLTKVLDGNLEAATLLANNVHRDCHLNIDISAIPSDISLPLTDCGIWIDPIDSTSEYIHGKREEPSPEGLVISGLQCVCVLIGVYSLRTGNPLIGIVNQPFHSWNSDENKWHGQCYWGISYGEVHLSSFNPSLTNTSSEAVVVVSSSESLDLINTLKKKYKVICTAGAGYKILAVALGLANLYFLSKGSTFRWDTCGPHALLLSLGGGIISYKTAMSDLLFTHSKDLHSIQLCYNTVEENFTGVDQWCNTDGVIAYRNPQMLLETVAFIQESKM